MKIYHAKAIELKYQGYRYKDISKAIGGKISEPVLRRYFSMEGMLYIPYYEYEERQNEWSIQEARNEYKRMAAYTAKIIKHILKQALKNDLRLAFNIVKYIDDMAGIGVVKKPETDTLENPTILTQEELHEELIKTDIDPLTGLRLSYLKKLSPEEKEEMLKELASNWYN